MCTLILSCSFIGCANRKSTQTTKQTESVVTEAHATSKKDKTEQTIKRIITNNTVTKIKNYEIPPYLKDASLKEVIDSKNNSNYQRDEEGEILVYEDVNFLGIEEINLSSYNTMLCYLFKDDKLFVERYIMDTTDDSIDAIKDYHLILQALSNLYGAPSINEKIPLDETTKTGDLKALNGDAAYVSQWQSNDTYIGITLYNKEDTYIIDFLRSNHPLNHLEDFYK